jgi:hypothetical protein
VVGVTPPTYSGSVTRRVIEADEVGWCHNCGTLQLFRDAAWLAVPYVYRNYEPVPCCSVCRESEPWELGVFTQSSVYASCAAAQHVTFWGTDDCDECGLLL